MVIWPSPQPPLTLEHHVLPRSLGLDHITKTEGGDGIEQNVLGSQLLHNALVVGERVGQRELSLGKARRPQIGY